MAECRFTNKAVEDLTSIWNYTYNKWSESQANKYYNILIDSCWEVASKPQLGKSYSEVTDQLLGFKAGRHIIFFRRIRKEDVEIIRTLHERLKLNPFERCFCRIVSFLHRTDIYYSYRGLIKISFY